MVKQHILNEGDLPPKLPVIFSDEIADRIRDIRFYNQFDKEGLSRLFSYIKGIKNHISNRAIAFSYGSASYSYGASIIYDFGVGFCLEDDSEKVYVKVVWLDLNLEDFGLNENRHIDKIITEVINQNTTNEFVSVSEFKYKGKELYNVGGGDSFAYFPCDIYGTPKLYYGDSHYSCAGSACEDILHSFGSCSYDWFNDYEYESIVEELWLDCCSERGRVYFEKYIVVGEDGHIPSSEYVSKVIEYMGGSPKDYSVLYNESNTVKEISADLFLKSGISGKKKPTKLSVPKKLKEVYERVVNRRYAADRKFPTNMTRAEYYWLTRQENRKINKILIETINQYLKQNLILN